MLPAVKVAYLRKSKYRINETKNPGIYINPLDLKLSFISSSLRFLHKRAKNVNLNLKFVDFRLGKSAFPHKGAKAKKNEPRQRNIDGTRLMKQ